MYYRILPRGQVRFLRELVGFTLVVLFIVDVTIPFDRVEAVVKDLAFLLVVDLVVASVVGLVVAVVAGVVPAVVFGRVYFTVFKVEEVVAVVAVVVRVVAVVVVVVDVVVFIVVVGDIVFSEDVKRVVGVVLTVDAVVVNFFMRDPKMKNLKITHYCTRARNDVMNHY